MESLSLRNIKIMPGNLNEIVRSWIRLLDSLVRDDSGNSLLIESTGLRGRVQQVRLPAQLTSFFGSRKKGNKNQAFGDS
jgi:hypothetical protein